MVTVSLIAPEPRGVQVEPADAAHVHLTEDSSGGKRSVTVAPLTSSGPPLVTVIVYTTLAPGTAVATPSSLSTDRSAVCAHTEAAQRLAAIATANVDRGIARRL